MILCAKRCSPEMANPKSVKGLDTELLKEFDKFIDNVRALSSHRDRLYIWVGCTEDLVRINFGTPLLATIVRY